MNIGTVMSERSNALSDITNITENVTRREPEVEAMSEGEYESIVRTKQPFIAHKDISNVSASTEEDFQTLEVRGKKEEELGEDDQEKKKEKKREYEMRSKRLKTLFKKTRDIFKIFPEAIILIKDHSGRWLMAGSPSLQSVVVEGRPLVDTSTFSVYKYDQTQGVDRDPPRLRRKHPTSKHHVAS